MMRRILLLVGVILLLTSMTLLSVSAESGVNQQIDLTDTPLKSVTVDEISLDDKLFTIKIELNETAKQNGSSVDWTYQICTNDLVCFAPEDGDIGKSGDEWVGTVMPLDDHTYINYIVVLNWTEGGGQRYPATGFGGKVWSSCWNDGVTWGGEDCPDGKVTNNETEVAVDDFEFTPAAGLPIVLAAMTGAIGFIARRQ
jgi:hypothetical protein